MAPGSSKLFVPAAAAAAAAAAVTPTLHGESAVRRRLFPGGGGGRRCIERPRRSRVCLAFEKMNHRNARNMLPGPPSSPPPQREQSTGTVKPPPSSRHWIPTRCSGIQSYLPHRSSVTVVGGQSK
ncbi:hypothetical protein LX32DRAFT_166715 [Colletotrichum zoysiae]|uniref:Uncharacterized protein n=1 Tax=Colletotrichum zoysiae TaxID=1216348 RepID=A0AAD9HPH9_9PEZI|nr:hypothetical protein LX32DRAFT_166715 [Colletotrichum zoysiae]